MVEISESWHEVTDGEDGRNPYPGTPSFAGFVARLEEETARLRELVDASEATAQALSERETDLDARERSLKAAHEELDARRAELEQWRKELEELQARTEHANARIADAEEREARLRSLAHELLQRYPEHG